jgi:hypothetical protein
MPEVADAVICAAFAAKSGGSLLETNRRALQAGRKCVAPREAVR